MDENLLTAKELKRKVINETAVLKIDVYRECENIISQLEHELKIGNSCVRITYNQDNVNIVKITNIVNKLKELEYITEYSEVNKRTGIDETIYYYVLTVRL